jgi:hypothetical protein
MNPDLAVAAVLGISLGLPVAIALGFIVVGKMRGWL